MTSKKSAVKSVPVSRYYNMLRVDYCNDAMFDQQMQERMIVQRKTLTRERQRFYNTVLEEPVYEKRKTRLGDKQYYAVPIGFYYRLEEIADDLKLKLDYVDKTPYTDKHQKRLIVDEKYLNSIKWREKQRPIIDDIMTYERGQYQASTGAGKTFLIAALTKIFPRAKILVTTVRRNTLKTLHEEIAAVGSYCGILASKMKDTAGRVLCCSVGMLPRVADDEWDIMLLDEKHECATLKRINLLTSVNARYVYGFSANHEERVDGADAWLESIFGQCRVAFSYADAVEEKSTAPIRVKWVESKEVLEQRLKTIPGVKPYFDKCCYVRNEARNILIHNLAKEYVDKGQTLVYCAWVEHIYALRKLLQCPVVHAEQQPDYWQKLQKRGLVGKDEDNPLQSELDELKKEFALGNIPLAIANSVWEVSVNFPKLKYLIRADWSASMSACRQIAGRLSRKSEGKEEGLLIDLVDTFNPTTFNRSTSRKAAYKKIGYEQTHWSWK